MMTNTWMIATQNIDRVSAAKECAWTMQLCIGMIMQFYKI